MLIKRFSSRVRHFVFGAADFFAQLLHRLYGPKFGIGFQGDSQASHGTVECIIGQT